MPMAPIHGIVSLRHMGPVNLGMIQIHHHVPLLHHRLVLLLGHDDSMVDDLYRDDCDGVYDHGLLVAGVVFDDDVIVYTEDFDVNHL